MKACATVLRADVPHRVKGDEKESSRGVVFAMLMSYESTLRKDTAKGDVGD